MYRTRLCPSVGAILRPLTQDTAASAPCSLRSFHSTSQRWEEKSNGTPSPAKPSIQPGTRQIRNRAAVGKVVNLLSPQTNTAQSGKPTMARRSPGVQGRPLIRREFVGPRTTEGQGQGAPGSAPPAGKMVRAPTQLRITRDPTGPRDGAPGARTGGPNLRGRRPPGGARPGQPGSRRREQRPQRQGPPKQAQDTIEDELSDGMVKQLLRLQRKEWDKVPYEPKYAKGSPAALELLEAGKKLFEGEKPKVKTELERKLERTIGVVGMHGV
ncbi:hypothetical protein M011DRAFT_178103 [Sporormia fimetaria CBS 119925]|uniref:Uncharacterized protein n=1 Tax=Sporormia fimetaria CBS 119925 TaxID=1340428 RepID=A0A6A6VN68_9PLEO|nr:hypothetical protein M011DRAFT_178103 [Sporormia fimetaria CBS 119925]